MENKMREILFRGKDIISGEWISGFLVDSKHIGDWVEADPVHPETVGQFTGLTDKNGVKIFEGDILKSATIFVVGFEDGSIVLRFEKNGLEYAHEHYLDEMLVIGNIHDNPELLEE